MDIISAIQSDTLFKSVFKDLSSWSSWMSLLKAFFAIEMTDRDLDLYRECTGRETPPVQPFRELWCVSGRRGGKSFMSSIIAVYLALFHDYCEFLAPGELGSILIISSDKAQSQTILNYTKGVLHSNVVFEQYIVDELKESVTLSNGIKIEVHTCNFRSIRGRTVVTGIFDECAFWMHDGSRPDYELLAAIRPAMSTIPTSKLIVVSSPYSRQGILFEHFEKYYGKDEERSILVWQSSTRQMNPTIPQELIDREIEKDPSAGRSEWLAIWRDDIEQFLSPEAIESCTVPGRISLPYSEKEKYHAFTDASGGRHDSFTAAVGHNSKGVVVIDYLFGRHPPFDPQQVVEEIADILKAYRISAVIGDSYAGEWTASAFEKAGIQYRVSDLVKSDLYISLEMKINTATIELPDSTILQKELIGLERRRGRSGRDRVDHHPKGSDDYANSVAGISYVASKFTGRIFPELLRRVSNAGV